MRHGAPLWSRYDADTLREIDEKGIPRNRPGTRFEKWRINSLGFRGDEIRPAKPPGLRRVVCLGQSESFGLYETADHEWPAQLGRLLRGRRPEVEVVNASVAGMGRLKRVSYVERYVLPLRPDVAVLTFNVFFEATAGSEGTASTTRPTWWRVFWDEGPRSRALAKARLRLRDAVPGALWRSLRLRRLTWRLREVEHARQGRPLDDLAADRLGGFAAHLREMIELLRARGVAPIVTTYPTLGSEANLARDVLEASEERMYVSEYSDLGLIRIASAMNDAARRVAREMNVPLADTEAAVPKSAKYFADYVHYTDDGAALVARCVADALDRAHLLSPGD